MFCYAIWVNGQKVVLAGNDQTLQMVANIWYHRMNVEPVLGVSAIVWKEGTVGASECYWDVPKLSLGDEVIIRLVEDDHPDPPSFQDIHGVKMPPPWGGGEDRCSFCGCDGVQRKKIFEGPKVKICAECVEFYHRLSQMHLPDGVA